MSDAYKNGEKAYLDNLGTNPYPVGSIEFERWDAGWLYEKEIKEPEKPKGKEMCIWIYDDWYETYETSCGQAYCFESPDLKENCYNYCPNCGKKIEPRRGQSPAGA